jgi:hypothetical protein
MGIPPLGMGMDRPSTIDHGFIGTPAPHRKQWTKGENIALTISENAEMLRWGRWGCTHSPHGKAESEPALAPLIDREQSHTTERDDKNDG